MAAIIGTASIALKGATPTMDGHQVIPAEAVEAATKAMEAVTPPPGVSKSDWLAEHGRFALIAGAVAAAAPHIRARMLEEAAAEVDDGQQAPHPRDAQSSRDSWRTQRQRG